MGKPVVIDVVVLPFPQTNLQTYKRRPALVVADLPGDDLILCQITSQVSVSPFPHSGRFPKWSPCPRQLHQAPTFVHCGENVILYTVRQVTPLKLQEVKGKLRRLWFSSKVVLFGVRCAMSTVRYTISSDQKVTCLPHHHRRLSHMRYEMILFWSKGRRKLHRRSPRNSPAACRRTVVREEAVANAQIVQEWDRHRQIARTIYSRTQGKAGVCVIGSCH